MKRFIETTIWTQNKWFRKLSPKHKLFWLYLICNCDSVGVWEEDLELASFIIGEEFTREDISNAFGEKIKWFNCKKLWITDFCHFQYGVLIEENKSNKPHQSYITLLKNHRLWIDYTKTIQRDKEKDKDKDKEEDKDKETILWKENFDIYRQEAEEAYKSLIADRDFILSKEEINPNVDILLTLKKAFIEYWGTEKGWKKRKATKTKTIDWRETYTNALNINKVYKQRTYQQPVLEQTKPKGAMI